MLGYFGQAPVDGKVRGASVGQQLSPGRAKPQGPTRYAGDTNLNPLSITFDFYPSHICLHELHFTLLLLRLVLFSSRCPRSTQEEAAEAYDIAAIKFRGLNAVTNFDMSRYDVNSIVNSNLPIGGLSAGSSKASESSPSSSSDTMSIDVKHQLHRHDPSASLGPATVAMKQDRDYWSLLALHHHQQQQQQQQSSQASGFSLFSSGSTMDFATAASNKVMSQDTGGGRVAWNNGMLEQQHEQSQGSSCTSVPYAAYVACGGGYGYEGANVSGWVAPPSSYYQQTSNPNVAAFQTAIFGME
ncbi:hypothetical protein BHE74_00043777 [Ensete ventricosum]|nr:hypothetical protein BHE74_00043777 [Ensete ventricosum]